MITLPQKQLKQRSIVIKPVGSFCNLRCDYCYYLDKHALYSGLPATHRMSDATMEKVIKDMFACSDWPTFIWHGGEPTMLGFDFFVKLVAWQRYYAVAGEYSNAIQTNGTLLNEEWADFMKNENFLVGISLDGPEHVHNRYRKDSRGDGTFRQVFENTKMLSGKGVNVNILATVNAYSAEYAEEIYEFFKKNKFFFMQFIPVVETDAGNPDIAASYSVTAQKYGVFLERLFDLWVGDFDFEQLKQKTSVRFFDALIMKYLGMTPAHCIFREVCGDALVVEHNGDIFSCDYMVSEDTYLGNIHEISLNEAFESKKHIDFGKSKSDFGTKCRECQWLDLCYGGCIKDRIRDPKDNGHNHFCESYKFFFKRADSRMKKFAELYIEHYQS